MLERGIVSRNQNMHKRTLDTSHVFKSMSTYDVATEGVMFFQVKYFYFILAAVILFSFFVLAFEWIAFGLKKIITKN